MSRTQRISFLRHIVRQLEQHAIEVHDDMYTTLAAMLAASSSTDDYDTYAWQHYDLWRRRPSQPEHITAATTATDDVVVSIRQRLQIISDGTTGLHTWHSSGALAEWAIANAAEVFEGRNVLELGAGTGLTGLVVAAVCRPARVVMTDGNAAVRQLLLDNVRANGHVIGDGDGGDGDGGCGIVDVRHLDWSDADGSSSSLLDKMRICDGKNVHGWRPDVILGADVVYDDTLVEPLCRTLDALFAESAGSGATPDRSHRPVCVAYLAIAVRKPNTLRLFVERLSELSEKYVGDIFRFVVVVLCPNAYNQRSTEHVNVSDVGQTGWLGRTDIMGVDRRPRHFGGDVRRLRA